jgi:tetratricopeptide (TPR) repeat protein
VVKLGRKHLNFYKYTKFKLDFINLLNVSNKALDCYKQSCKLADKLNDISGFNSKYNKALELKNIGEMSYILGDAINSERYFLKVREKMNELSEHEKAFILWNLACAYRRISNFDREYKILSELIYYFEKIYIPDLENGVQNRLNELNLYENILDNGKCDSTKLKKIDDYNKSKELYLKGEHLFHSFQFDKALYLFMKANELEKTTHLDETETLKYIALTHIFLEDLSKAETYYEKVIEYSYDNIPAHVYLGLIKIKKNRFDSGLIELDHSFEVATKISNGYQMALRLCIKWLQGFKLKELTYPIFDRLAFKLSTIEDNKFSPFLEIGAAFAEMGFYEEAIYYYDAGLLKENDDRNKSCLYNNKGMVLAEQGLNDKALLMYDEAKKVWKENHNLWFNMALSYSYELDFLKAKECVEEAMKYSPNKVYKKLKDEYDYLSNDVINFGSIKDDNIETVFKTAEITLLHLHKIKYANEFEFSTALGEYRKGLEILLDRYISSKLKERICKELDINKHFHGDYKTISPIIALLRHDKSISPGQWARLIDDLDKEIENELFEKFKEVIEKMYDYEELIKIKQACAMIAKYGNPASHTDIKTRDKALEERKYIIQHLNRVIQIISTKFA